MNIKEMRNNKGFAKLTGIEIIEVNEGFASAKLYCDEKLLNALDTIHGGALFALADATTGAAAASYGFKMSTANASFNYYSPATENMTLTCIATEIKHGNSLLVFDAKIFNENNKLIAGGTFTYFNLKIHY